MPRQKRDPIVCLFNARKKVAPDQYEKVAPVKKCLLEQPFSQGVPVYGTHLQRKCYPLLSKPIILSLLIQNFQPCPKRR